MINDENDDALEVDGSGSGRFFFAEDDAPFYDVAPDLNTPRYTQAHEVLLQLVDYFFSNRTAEGVLIDIGSGTGAESIPILEKYPNLRLVALDLCEPMHAEFEKKARQRLGDKGFEERCVCITGDISGDKGDPHSLLRAAEVQLNHRFSLAISGFTLHHLDAASKQETYRRIYSALEPGGAFINADLFSFRSTALAKEAQRLMVDWIDRHHRKSTTEFHEQFEALGTRRERFRREWIHHVETFNCPIPIEWLNHSQNASHSEQANEVEMLLRAGFDEVECVMRYWQVGVLWATKQS